MRMLQSSGELDAEDLEAAYAYPAERTWTRLNFVTSLDGSTTDARGRAGGLSSKDDQRVFHLLRSMADVVVVGAGTARAEGYERVAADEVDADLRSRLGLAPLPPIAVVSRSLDLPADLVAGPRESATTLVVTCGAAPADRLAAVREHADVLVCGDGGVDQRVLREELAGRGLRRILCEGGPTLAAAQAAAGVLDEVCLTVRPQLLAGPASRFAAGPLLDPALELRLAHAILADDDLLLRYVSRSGDRVRS